MDSNRGAGEGGRAENSAEKVEEPGRELGLVSLFFLLEDLNKAFGGGFICVL